MTGDDGSLLPTLGDRSTGAPLIVTSCYADTSMMHMRSNLFEAKRRNSDLMTVIFISNTDDIQSLCGFIEGLVMCLTHTQESIQVILITPGQEHIDQNYLSESTKW